MSNLGALLTLEYGEALPAETRSGDGYAVFGSNGAVGKHHAFLVPGPGIVVGRKGSVGEVAWSAEPFWPIDTTYWVNCLAEDRRWLFWALSWLPLHRLDTSTGVPGLNRKDVYALEIDRPSMPERQIITQVLDVLEAAVRDTIVAIAKLRAVKQGLLHDLLTRGIDANGELRPPQWEAPHLYQESQLGFIPADWTVRTLKEITSSPICYGIVQVLEHILDGIPVLAIRDLEGDYLTGIHRTAKSIDAAYPRSRVRSGDVLLSIKGTIGRIGVVPDHFVGNISRDVALIRPAEAIRPDFLAQLLRSPFGQNIISQAQVGTTRAEISIAPLRKIAVTLPEVEEQERIELALRSADDRLREEEKSLGKLTSMTSGLMDDLLTGRVRVTPLLGGVGSCSSWSSTSRSS
jgi:type I restriction enzyme S subunit